MEMFKVILKEDVLLSEYLKSLNFGIHRYNELLNQKKIKVNNVAITKDQKLIKGDKLLIDLTLFKMKTSIVPIETTMRLHILYEDDYILVVDKPGNMIIYPDENQSNVLTLAHLVKKYYDENGIDSGVYHLHRLDRDTRGCILYAKDLITLAALSKMMENHQVIRHYKALVEGRLPKKKGIIDKPIAKDRHHNNKMICNENGKRAVTEYQVVKEYANNTSLVKINLKTGRTHQIRVHFAAINHPLVNDPLYNPNYKSGNYDLISLDIAFRHPITNEQIYVAKS